MLGIEIKLTPFQVNRLTVLNMKKNQMGCSSVQCFLNVGQKCTVLCLADVECLPVIEVVLCMSISCLFCVYHALSERLLDLSTVCSFVMFLLHLYNWICRLSLIFISHLFFAHVVLSIMFHLSIAVVGVEDVCSIYGLPMVVSYISDTY